MNIQLRRKGEDRLLAATLVTKEHVKLAEIADFEKRSTAKVHGVLMKKRVAEENKKLRNEIDDRRRRLARFLAAEREEFEREISASFETPEQAKERCVRYSSLQSLVSLLE